MNKAEVIITNRRGLAARSAAKLALTANRYASDIWLECGNRRVDAKNIMAVMLLGVRPGSALTVETHGDDAEMALHAVVELVQRKFDETR